MESESSYAEITQVICQSYVDINQNEETVKLQVVLIEYNVKKELTNGGHSDDGKI